MDTFFTSAELPAGLRGAFAESRISLSLADAKAQDMPLIAVNQAFCDMSGYGPDEVLDRNCRFHQPDESPDAVRKDMQEFLHDSDKPRRAFRHSERYEGWAEIPESGVHGEARERR